jgi:hypothetical protein
MRYSPRDLALPKATASRARGWRNGKPGRSKQRPLPSIAEISPGTLICYLAFTYSSKLKEGEVHPRNSEWEVARRGV